MALNGLDAPTLAFFPTGHSLPLLRASTGMFGVNDGSAFALETVF